MPNPLSEHHVVLGISLILIGAFGALGSITGRLAPMIAGLFDPSDLTTPTGAVTPGVEGGIEGLSGAGPANSAIGNSTAQGLWGAFTGIFNGGLSGAL